MNNSSKNKLIQLLKENKVIKFGKFTLSSGRESDYYVDMKRAVTSPLILRQVAEIISERLDRDSVDKVAGPALGAIPIVTAVSLGTGIPMLMIRSAKKDYGTSNLIEGDLSPGDQVVVLEDVTTTGHSLIDAIKTIEEKGGKVQKAFVIVDRDEGAVKNIRDEGIDFEPLVTVDELR
ncbi:MAG: Orotate phosphoribosyltransferase [Methanobacterium sp. PtaU1.Bin097]|jgi:orotate phosphoribosyltransferase|nr:MAG: Orotate phosphoribosyltransferase [Methanobacterium sp. PtaU1.Bin097]